MCISGYLGWFVDSPPSFLADAHVAMMDWKREEAMMRPVTFK